MAITAEDFYRSSNGDRWRLVRDTASGRSLFALLQESVLAAFAGDMALRLLVHPRF